MTSPNGAQQTLCLRCGQPQRNLALTARQAELLDCLRSGASNAEIGRQLGISRNTVRAHLYDIMARTGHRNRTELALWWAARRGDG